MKNKLFIFLAAFALSATSCNDWLDVQPNTMKPASTIFDSYQGYQDALNGCYLKMKSRSLYGLHLTVTTVEYLAQHWDTYDPDETVEAIKRYDYGDANVEPIFKNIYSGLYNVIVQANTIIEAIPETGIKAIPEEQARGVIEGEAYAIRAMCHFEILRLFGQVPGGSKQVKLPYTEGVSRIPADYCDYAAFTGKIERDLAIADSLLLRHDPFVKYSVTQVNGSTISDNFLRYRQLRLNYWAVKALQARFYLYINKPAEAYKAAMTVIDVSDKNWVYNKGFGLAGEEDVPDPDYPTTKYNNIRSLYYALPYEGLFMLSNHQLNDYINSYLRINNQVVLYMDIAKVQGEGMFEEEKSGTRNNRLLYLWWQKQTGSTVAGRPSEVMQPLKYDQSSASGMSNLNLLLYKQVMPMLRLSELYLIAMETSNNMDEINELYDTYRQARNIQEQYTYANKEDVLLMIEKEYRRELFAEGQMFAFYKRRNSASMLWAARNMNENDYIVPLPNTEYDPNL